MKKTLILCFIILIGSFSLFYFLGSKDGYSAEKSFWRINRNFSVITKDVKTTPEASFQKIIKDYDKFIKKFPNSALLPKVYILKAKAYIFKKDYIMARKELENIIIKYQDAKPIVVKALEFILQSYALEEDDSNILKTYNRVITDYPVTSLGLKAPLLISQFYTQRKEYQRGIKALDEALTYYQSLAKEYSDSPVQYTILELTTTCYLGKKQWKQALNVLAEMLIKFSSPQYLTPQKAIELTKTINTIAVFQLKNKQLAVKIYKKFISTHPKHPFNKTMNLMVQKLEDLKSNSK